MEACELSSSYCVWLASWPPTGLSRYLFSRFVLALMYAEWRIVQLRPAIPLRHVSVEMQALFCAYAVAIRAVNLTFGSLV